MGKVLSRPPDLYYVLFKRYTEWGIKDIAMPSQIRRLWQTGLAVDVSGDPQRPLDYAPRITRYCNLLVTRVRHVLSNTSPDFYFFQYCIDLAVVAILLDEEENEKYGKV
ncbi:hypothetical protein NQ317_019873 [Molorchus minor]|uniref:Uncharacterized protein n=1 Tax=Molorchus minor TaxID=1323400 RepID=A0ABQ9J9Q5_9CUCU|nr:hypothetical protein NQ317_019873 [Molorchus minor]